MPSSSNGKIAAKLFRLPNFTRSLRNEFFLVRSIFLRSNQSDKKMGRRANHYPPIRRLTTPLIEAPVQTIETPPQVETPQLLSPQRPPARPLAAKTSR